MLKLSLCCISNTLAARGVKFQTMTYQRFASLNRGEAVRILSSRILNNFRVNHQTIKFCVSSGYAGYRMSSSLMPLIDHPDVNLSLDELPDFDEIVDELDATGKTIKSTGIRITAHPSEYISLTSEDDRVIQNSIKDLTAHGELFDLLDLPLSPLAPLNIHIRRDGAPEAVSGRFWANYGRLPASVRSRLVLENNDNAKGVWSIQNLYNFLHLRYGFPITFDNLHHKMLPGGLTEQEAFELAYSTWPCEPVFHYSEGIDGTRKHADYATELPNSYGKIVLFECEVKAKDYAINQILEKIK